MMRLASAAALAAAAYAAVPADYVPTLPGFGEYHAPLCSVRCRRRRQVAERVICKHPYSQMHC